MSFYATYTFDDVMKMIKDKDSRFNAYFRVYSPECDLENYRPINFVPFAMWEYGEFDIRDLMSWAGERMPDSVSICMNLTVFKEDMTKPDGKISVNFQTSGRQIRDMEAAGVDVIPATVKRMVAEVLHYLLK